MRPTRLPVVLQVEPIGDCAPRQRHCTIATQQVLAPGKVECLHLASKGVPCSGKPCSTRCAAPLMDTNAHIGGARTKHQPMRDG